MNRHDRRAQEARTRSNFQDYSALYRRAFKSTDDRAIGEGFMRGEAADGIDGAILHAPGEPKPPLKLCDAQISMGYGSQRFVARALPKHIAVLEREWPKAIAVLRRVAGRPEPADTRDEARGFAFEMLVDNHHYESGPSAALVASAIVWLARTSPAGAAIGTDHMAVHYEVTDTGPGIPPGAGPRAKNFRLMVARDAALLNASIADMTPTVGHEAS